MRISHVICALGLVLSVAAPAQAQTDLAGEVTRLLAGRNADQAKAPVLKQEVDQLVAANERLLKEGKLYQDQIKVRLGPIADAIKADSARLQADTQRHNQGVAAHNSVCAGTLPRPQYERCQGQKPYWDRSKANLDGRKVQIQARGRDYDRQYRQYAVRLDQISAQMKQNFATWQQKKRALEEIEARLKDYAARLLRVCNLAVRAKNSDRPDLASNAEEALKHCHSVNWDGANPNLPPLIDVKPPSRAN